MAKTPSTKLKWTKVRLGEDLNWWVSETSDPVNWDTVDGLSILDPRQVGYLLESTQPLLEYGFEISYIEHAFFKFHIEKEIAKGQIQLGRVPDALSAMTEPLFALPDILDDERGPYADLLHQLSSARVRMLNDLIDFEEELTIEEVEDEIREMQNEEYMEGRSIHVFNELLAILEYVPEGYELDIEEDAPSTMGLDEEDFPDVDDEKIDEDDTMKWEEEEEEEMPIDDTYEGAPPDEVEVQLALEKAAAEKKKPAAKKKAAAKKKTTKKKK